MAAAVGSALLWSVCTPQAQACSPSAPPPGFGAFLEHLPGTDAIGVPTNPAVILYVERFGHIDGFTVTVSEQVTARVVAGSSGNYHQNRELVAWRPSAPLRPLTRYRVDAAVISAGARPPQAMGAAQISFGFMTGDKPLPPITLQGQMQVQIERFQREDKTRCTSTPICGNCGAGCYCQSTAAREEATIARVLLPSFTGGLSTPGYYALMRVTRGVPYQFPQGEDNTATGVVGTGSSSDIVEGAQTELLATLDYMVPYQRPCFALRVTDLAGNASEADPVCLDVTVDGVQQLPLPPGTAVQPPPQPSPGPQPPGPDPMPTSGGGCIVAPVGGHAALPLWAIGVALLFLKRASARVRPARAPRR